MSIKNAISPLSLVGDRSPLFRTDVFIPKRPHFKFGLPGVLFRFPIDLADCTQPSEIMVKKYQPLQRFIHEPGNQIDGYSMWRLVGCCRL
jgi:hypothetical protein